MALTQLVFGNERVIEALVDFEGGNAEPTWAEKVMREALTNLSDKRASAHVGKIIAERAQAAAIPAVHFQKPKVGACG